MLTFVLFILILSILVLIHEFGHFYVAKKTGVRVEEFGFGLPPRIFGKKIGETLYSINLLPFGGFVKLTGEDELVPSATVDTPVADSHNFASKSALQRSAIIVAGVFMNSLLAVILYYLFFTFTSFRSFPIPNYFDYVFRFGTPITQETVVMSYGTDSAAYNAGINLGEAVVEIDGKEVSTVSEVREAMKGKVGVNSSVLVRDMRSVDQVERLVIVVPQADINGDGVLGVYLGESVVLDYSKTKILSGPLHAYNIFGFSMFSFGKIISASFEERDLSVVSSSVSGPVGIFSIVGGILDYSSTLEEPAARIRTAFLGIVDLTALFSISLAFLNIMPFPALDGGRLLFIFIEKLLGRKLPPKYEIAFHKAGMLILLLLLVLVTIRDVKRIIG